jgi:hypothetical protein
LTIAKKRRPIFSYERARYAFGISTDHHYPAAVALAISGIVALFAYRSRQRSRQ